MGDTQDDSEKGEPLDPPPKEKKSFSFTKKKSKKDVESSEPEPKEKKSFSFKKKKDTKDEGQKEEMEEPEPEAKKSGLLSKMKGSEKSSVADDSSTARSPRFRSPFKRSKSKPASDPAEEGTSDVAVPLVTPPPTVTPRVEDVPKEDTPHNFISDAPSDAFPQSERSEELHDRYESVVAVAEPEPEQNTFCGLVCCY